MGLTVYRRILFFLALGFNLNSCYRTENVYQDTKIQEIVYGSGGGFTGQRKIYRLTANSELFQGNEMLKKNNFKLTNKLFNEAKDLIDYKFNNPNNIYDFIEIKSDNKINRIVWSDESQKVDKRVTILYDKLINAIK